MHDDRNVKLEIAKPVQFGTKTGSISDYALNAFVTLVYHVFVADYST